MTTDLELITRIKEQNDSEAMTELVNRHTGIYFGVMQKYAASYPAIIKLDEMKDDKMFNIYKFVVDYDATKGTKFSTYICERAEWLCKGLLKDDGRPTYLSVKKTDYLDATTRDDGSTDQRGGIADESPEAQVEESANRDLSLELIVEWAETHVKDPRFLQIVRMRHFDSPALTWRQVGTRLGVTHERARQIYQEHVAKMKGRLQEKVMV